MLANRLTQLTIGVSAHVEKAGVRHFPRESVFIALCPGQPIVYGNPPFLIMSITGSDSRRIARRQHLVSAIRAPDTNNPYAFRKHENSVARPYSLHVCGMFEFRPDRRIVAPPHQTFILSVRRMPAIGVA